MDKRRKFSISLTILSAVALLLASESTPARAQGGMGAEQAEEKRQLQQMHSEVGDIKSEMNDALQGLDQLGHSMSHQAEVKEFHLFAKRAACEITPALRLDCLTYNGKLPGPILRVNEGDAVRIVLHNQLDAPTSISFHGLITPQNVGGLPRKDAGLVSPGQTYVYQFVAKQSGTFWYHPQVPHNDEKTQGLYGALIIDSPAKGYDRDFVIVLSTVHQSNRASNTRAGSSAVPPSPSGTTNYLFNGKSAPAIPPIEVHENERIRLRVINAGQESIPLHLSGHHLEVVAVNGSDPGEPHVFRDTVTINPSDRYDFEFTANNPGVWSLASELFSQSTTDGKFPGGIACVVRYPTAVK